MIIKISNMYFNIIKVSAIIAFIGTVSAWNLPFLNGGISRRGGDELDVRI